VLPRLIITVLPVSLPYDRAALWKNWGSQGLELSIDGDPELITELLLKGPPPISELLGHHGSSECSDVWLIDGGATPSQSAPSGASVLNYARLTTFREAVLARIDSIPKNIAATDQTLATIRNQNWDAWYPPELMDRAPLRRFLIDLYLSGNGSLIFSNSFVEWAASEAIRRARPRVLVARFGLRPRPKPFTGIAIFENQQRINTLPEIDDPTGSALDANVLARYVLLAAQRYPEKEETICLCIAESARSAWLLLPETRKNDWTNSNTCTPAQLARWLMQYVASL
jgi:hypothetical protein